MSLFDVFTVSIIPSVYGSLTVMSAPPSHYIGARPKTTGTPSNIKYACVACEFSDFKTAHSLRRHMIRVHNLACDTLVQGRLIPHVGYIMRRPNARELYDFPCLVFPKGWAVNYRQDVDPQAVSDRPPFGHRLVGVRPDVQCVPIMNPDGSDHLFGRNRSVTVDTVAVRQSDRNIDKHIQMLRARSTGIKRPHESPGVESNRRYVDWVASLGDVTGGSSGNLYLIHTVESHSMTKMKLLRTLVRLSNQQPFLLKKQLIASGEWTAMTLSTHQPNTVKAE